MAGMYVYVVLKEEEEGVVVVVKTQSRTGMK
jgi:hypothetical protein